MNSNSPLLRRIDDYVAQHQLITPGDTIVIGLSGGPDSVFLLHYLLSLQEKMKLQFIAAHLNHGWRAEANEDQEWCANLCKQLNVPFVTKHAQEIILDQKPNGSKEEQGRLLRRAFFNEVAQDYKANAIALGHHQDDSIETFFLNLIRGATISGLRGIKAKQGNIIRPLLGITKPEIISYLKDNHISYLEDITNDQLDFLRNRIRHQIIPAFEATDMRYENKIVQAMHYFSEIDGFLDQITQETLNKITQDSSIDLSAFNELSPFLKRRVLLAWLKRHQVPVIYSTAWLDEILRFIETGKKPAHTIVENWQIQKHINNLILQRNPL